MLQSVQQKQLQSYSKYSAVVILSMQQKQWLITIVIL